MANAKNTSDREVNYGISWINYWRAMTSIFDNLLHCLSCGKEIYAGEILRYKFWVIIVFPKLWVDIAGFMVQIINQEAD